MNTDPYVRDVLAQIPTTSLQALGRRHIFFGHQSVGSDILSGVQSLSRQGLVALDVVEGRSTEALGLRPALAHARIGENRNPSSKIKDFAALMHSGLGARMDVALLKFCYVDFESKAHLPEVFDEYKSTLAALQAEFPKLTIVHVTSPLTDVQRGPKAILKSILGRKPAGVAANVARHEFNQMMREEYEGKAPLFDLAVIESTYPDGRRALFREDGRSYPKLTSSYSSDGGHLNENGARWVAAHLIRFLATLPEV